MASLSQGRTAAAQCGLFTYKSVPVIFETPCIFFYGENISFDASLVIYRNSTNIPPIMIINRIYET